MSPITALRAKRSAVDLPSMPSDDELLAWSRSLVAEPAVERPRPRRAEPLRATRRDEHMALDEIFEEIEERLRRS